MCMNTEFHTGENMEIKRDFYLKQLIERKHNGLVKVITGLRRVGKSYLLFRLFKDHLLASGVKASQIIEIALDQAAFENLQNPLALAEYIRERIKGKKQFYVLIDEIQLSLKVRKKGIKLADIAPEDRKHAYVTFYDVLNELKAKPNVDVYVTGSNSKMLSKDIATNFRDRGFEIKVYPLSLGEYIEATGLDKAEAFDEYLIWGGMPMAVLERKDSVRSKYLKDLFAKVYMKVYIQSAFRIPDEEKREQEKNSLKWSGDFFRKIVVTAGTRRPLADEDGIIYVGVIPFLLDPSILES